MGAEGLLIGITGGFGSGKSLAASFLESKGFKKITLALFLEEEAGRHGFKEITRTILQDIGNEWRKTFGNGVLAEKAVDYIKKEKIKKAVIDGIRNVGEVKRLRKEKNFILLAIIADKKIRFERLKNLKRREKLTWKLFQKLDKRDMGLGQKQTGLQVLACLRKADYYIKNNKSLDEFKNNLAEFLGSIKLS